MPRTPARIAGARGDWQRLYRSSSGCSWENGGCCDAVGAGAVARVNLYSLVKTDKADGVEAGTYLSSMFERVPQCGIEDFEALLSWSLKPTNTARPHLRDHRIAISPFRQE
jgi:hypothetical protein